LQCQMVQEDRERILLKLVTERPLTLDEEGSLVAYVQAALEHPFQIRISYFEGRIPAGANGKFEEFVSHAH